MNNQQFRRLLFDKDTSSHSSKAQDAASTPSSKPSATPALGSRARSSIPMTPRNIHGSASELFQRQLREQRESQTQAKKFKSSAAPKGYKLAAGYTDRAAQLRATEDGEGKDENSKEARIKALEEMVKLGQMEMKDFERVRDEIVGGDVRNVHLVKGLDWKLLKRARAGEDVYQTPMRENEEEQAATEEDPVDLDEQLENLETADVKPIEREQRAKHGAMPASSVPVAGKKRTRDDILREMKEARARAAAEQKAAQQPALGTHFKKIGPKYAPNTTTIEKDELGRDVLIVVDANGNVKKKVKKQKTGANGAGAVIPLPMPDKAAKPLGMDVEVPNNMKKTEPEEEEDDDIFADAGSDYNPLGNLQDDDTESDESEDGESKKRSIKTQDAYITGKQQSMEGDPEVSGTTSERPRNYFGSEMDTGDSSKDFNPMNDPSIMNALKRASATKAADASSEQSGDTDAEKARLARMRARLAEQDRDAEDMDMGFGSSRFEDQDEGDERHVKLAKWKGLTQGDDDDDDEGDGEQTGRGGQSQRKRGKKKKKADKNDAGAVLGILEKRKGA